MSYIAVYIEQAGPTAGLYKKLNEPGTQAQAQAALDAQVTSSGDRDPTHYRVFEVAQVFTPTNRGGGFLV